MLQSYVCMEFLISKCHIQTPSSYVIYVGKNFQNNLINLIGEYFNENPHLGLECCYRKFDLFFFCIKLSQMYVYVNKNLVKYLTCQIIDVDLISLYLFNIYSFKISYQNSNFSSFVQLYKYKYTKNLFVIYVIVEARKQHNFIVY